MTKIEDEALARLKNRVERLNRLLVLDAPVPVLVYESYLIMEAGRMLGPDIWLAREKDRIISTAKREMALCDEMDCEEPIAWIPSATSGAPPGPFHLQCCAKHAVETEQMMKKDDEDDEGAK